MKAVIAQMIELQRMDNRIAEIETTLAVLPGEVQEVQDKLTKAQAEVSVLTAAVEACEKEQLTLRAEIEERKSLQENAQKKLSGVKSNKEYEAVLKELDTLKKLISDAETKSKALVEQIAEKKGLLAAAEEACGTLVGENTQLIDDKGRQDKDLTDELAGLKTAREEFAATVRKQHLSKYERVRTARNNLAIVRAENETCTGCYMKIPPRLFVEVMRSQELQQCPNCHRFLYHPDQQEGEAAE